MKLTVYQQRAKALECQRKLERISEAESWLVKQGFEATTLEKVRVLLEEMRAEIYDQIEKIYAETT